MTAVKSSKLVIPTLMVGIIAMSQRCLASSANGQQEGVLGREQLEESISYGPRRGKYGSPSRARCRSPYSSRSPYARDGLVGEWYRAHTDQWPIPEGEYYPTETESYPCTSDAYTSENEPIIPVRVPEPVRDEREGTRSQVLHDADKKTTQKPKSRWCFSRCFCGRRERSPSPESSSGIKVSDAEEQKAQKTFKQVLKKVRRCFTKEKKAAWRELVKSTDVSDLNGEKMSAVYGEIEYCEWQLIKDELSELEPNVRQRVMELLLKKAEIEVELKRELDAKAKSGVADGHIDIQTRWYTSVYKKVTSLSFEHIPYAVFCLGLIAECCPNEWIPEGLSHTILGLGTVFNTLKLFSAGRLTADPAKMGTGKIFVPGKPKRRLLARLAISKMN